MENSLRLLKKAIDFHGHLGPYLVLGLKMGPLALKEIKAGKHFGVEVIVRGACLKPKSCLIDGLQLSTGATFGKGNIEKRNGSIIEAVIKNKKTRETIRLRLRKGLIKKIGDLKTHKDSEQLARQFYKTSASDLFEIK